MTKHDSRSFPQEVQQYNRYLAILHFQDDKTRKDIAEIIGVKYVTAWDWIRAWREGGKDALQLQKRGRSSEEQRLFTKDQE